MSRKMENRIVINQTDVNLKFPIFSQASLSLSLHSHTFIYDLRKRKKRGRKLHFGRILREYTDTQCHVNVNFLPFILFFYMLRLVSTIKRPLEYFHRASIL